MPAQPGLLKQELMCQVCSLLSKMLSGPIGCIQKGLVVFGSVLDLPAECEVASCVFQRTHMLLNK